MKGYKETNVTKTGDTMMGQLIVPADLHITGTDYPAIKFIDKNSETTKGAFLTQIETAQPYIRSYTLDESNNNTGLYSNYFLPTSNRISEDDEKNYHIITTQNLYENIPIGSCFTTSTNTNPFTILGGGTWSLIDKRFTPARYYSATNGTLISMTTANATLKSIYVILKDSNINVRLNFNNEVAFSDNGWAIGTLALDDIGISSTDLTHYYGSGYCDALNGVFSFNMTTAGVLTIVDISKDFSTSTDLSAWCDFTFTVRHNYMLDSFCNQFIWKRTA